MKTARSRHVTCPHETRYQAESDFALVLCLIVIGNVLFIEFCFFFLFCLVLMYLCHSVYVCMYVCTHFSALSVTCVFLLIQHLHKQELCSHIFRSPADVTLGKLHLQVLTRYTSYVSNAHWTIGSTVTCSICHFCLISHASLINFSISQLHTISVFSVYGAAKSNCFGFIS